MPQVQGVKGEAVRQRALADYRALNNAGDGVSSAFPKGKQNEEINKKIIIPLSLVYN